MSQGNGTLIPCRPAAGTAERLDRLVREALPPELQHLADGAMATALGEAISYAQTSLSPAQDVWTAALATRHIRAQLAERPHGGDLLSFVPVIAGTPERAFAIWGAVAAILIASLELARDGEVGLDQPRLAAPISLSLRTQAEASSASEGIAPA